ncbi:hypothetical protein IWW50_003036 [Coemansia erecta]|nr:hypothetical protein IWW50_003036 [Coemansia erecta]
MVGMPDATEVSIMPVGAEITPEMAQPSPEADWPVPSYSKDQKITEEFYACIQQHGGQNAWINPADGCNTCICTLHGTIACTKKLCSPVHQAADAVSQAMNQASDVHTTVMVPLASASGDAESTFYTSVPIDIDA